MATHIGNRAKLLVDNNWKGSKKDFSKAMGFSQPTYLFQLFQKEDIGTDVLKRMALLLKIDLIQFFTDEQYVKNERKTPGKPEADITKDKLELEMLREMAELLRESNSLYKEEIKKLKKELAANKQMK